MAGIYIHIPYCKRKCAYCDFFSVANLNSKSEFVNALIKEIELRRNYFNDEKIRTVYFGGGTPSVLSLNEIEVILNELHKYFQIENSNEITMEANPDDLNAEYLNGLKSLGVNRLSVGIQSFNERDLTLMKRKHSVSQSVKSVKEAQDAGFSNISIDLIYGLPNLSLLEWEQNIVQAIKLNIQHISAYHLTIEPNTLFSKYFREQKITLPSDNESIDQFKMLRALTAKNGFVHYEISNFALDGFLSLHNTNYWMDVKYLGLGPSAHSYNLTSREWNIQNLHEYMQAISKGKLANETEILSEKEKYNDFLITSFRTMWGVNFENLKNKFGEKYQKIFYVNSEKFLAGDILKKINENYILTEKGMFISDNIISEFLYV